MVKERDDDHELDILLSHRSPPRRLPVEGGGVSILDVLELPADLRTAMNSVTRLGRATAVQVASSIHVEVTKAAQLLDTLVARGHLRQIGRGAQSVYEPALGRSRRPGLSSELWEKLERG